MQRLVERTGHIRGLTFGRCYKNGCYASARERLQNTPKCSGSDSRALPQHPSNVNHYHKDTPSQGLSITGSIHQRDYPSQGLAITGIIHLRESLYLRVPMS